MCIIGYAEPKDGGSSRKDTKSFAKDVSPVGSKKVITLKAAPTKSPLINEPTIEKALPIFPKELVILPIESLIPPREFEIPPKVSPNCPSNLKPPKGPLIVMPEISSNSLSLVEAENSEPVEPASPPKAPNPPIPLGLPSEQVMGVGAALPKTQTPGIITPYG